MAFNSKQYFHCIFSSFSLKTMLYEENQAIAHQGDLVNLIMAYWKYGQLHIQIHMISRKLKYF